MAISFGSAVNAYREAAGAVEGAMGTQKTQSPQSGDNSFVNMVTDSLQNSAQVGWHAEEMTLKQIAGEADLKDVVTAVANAEHTLETVIAVRDKVLTAYQEILRMPI